MIRDFTYKPHQVLKVQVKVPEKVQFIPGAQGKRVMVPINQLELCVFPMMLSVYNWTGLHHDFAMEKSRELSKIKSE